MSHLIKLKFDVNSTMASWVKAWFLTLLAIGVISLQAGLVSAEEASPLTKLEMGCNNFPPLKIEGVGGSSPGIHVEILQSALNGAGLDLEYRFLPWKRAYTMAAKGKLDGLCSCSYRKDREADFWFSEQIDHSIVGVFTSADIPKKIRSLSDLQGLHVGVVRGYNLESELKEHGIEFLAANGEEQLLKMLLKGRIDAIFSFEKPVLYYARNMVPYPTLAFFAFRASPVFVCFSKRSKGVEVVLPRFNKALDHLKEIGKIDEIVQKYR